MEYRLGLILPGNRGMLRRLFRGFPLDEMNARLALEFPERAAIQASIKEYVRSHSPSLSVSLPPLHLLWVVKFRKLSLKFKFQRAVFVFFSRFFVNAKRKRGKCFANWHILFIVWFRLPNKWYSIVPLWCVPSTQSALGQDTHTRTHSCRYKDTYL